LNSKKTILRVLVVYLYPKSWYFFKSIKHAKSSQNIDVRESFFSRFYRKRI